MHAIFPNKNNDLLVDRYNFIKKNKAYKFGLSF